MDAKILSLNTCKTTLEDELRRLEQVEKVVIEFPTLWRGLLVRREQIHADLRFIRDHRKFLLDQGDT